MTNQIKYLKCTRDEKHPRYYRVTLDKAAGVLILKGRHGQFTEKLRPPSEFAKIGYEVVLGPEGLEMSDG